MKTRQTVLPRSRPNVIVSYYTDLTSYWVRHTVSVLESKTEEEHAKNVFHSLDCMSPETHLAKEEIKLIGFGRITECRKMFPKGASPDTANKKHVFV